MEKDKILRRTQECNVSYHLPGQTDRSAMPLGNGETGNAESEFFTQSFQRRRVSPGAAYNRRAD